MLGRSEEILGATVKNLSSPEEEVRSSAANELLPSIYDIAYRTARLWTARHKGVDPEDVAQEAMFRIFKLLQKGSFDASRGSLLAWMHAVIRHVVHEHSRRQSRLSHRLEDYSTDSTRGWIDGGQGDPAKGFAAEEAREVVEKLLLQLTDKQQEIIRLYYFDGLTSYQVAERLGLTPNTVRSLMHRALARLRQLLVDSGFKE